MQTAKQDSTWQKRDLKGLEANLLDERSSSWMYRSLAGLDRQEERAAMFGRLAQYEETHASLWEELLHHLNRPIPRRERLLEHRILIWLARMFGARMVLPIVHKNEVEGIARYKRQANSWQDPKAQQIFQEILPDEIAHEIDVLDSIRQFGALGGELRSAILGANDGLASILALVVGVAAATQSSASVLIAGLAGLLAGAVSMTASNFVSVKAEQELYLSETRLQREALAVAPESKKAQLKGIYLRKGLSEEEATSFVDRLAEKPQVLLNALLSEERGITQRSFENPLRLALYTGVAFALAGSVPVMPFLFFPAMPGAMVSAALAGVALFIAGVVRALSTLSPFIRSGLEMVLIGMGSALATYLVGLAMGVIVD